MAHSQISPSSSSRWMKCPASVPWSADVERSSNVQSAAGTLLHRIVEYGLRNDQDLSAYQDTTELVDGYEITVTEKHLLIAKTYCDYITQLHRDMGGCLYIEQKVTADEIHPECVGTADALVVADDRMAVCDFKTGRWPVEVADNPQLKIYALGALTMYGTPEHRTIDTIIVQPTAWHKDGAIRVHSYDVDNLVEWGFETLRPAALKCFEPDPTPVAGEHCRFCPAKPKCPHHGDEI